MPHIAIVGAGITGVTTAYALRNRGYEVTVFDRQRYPAMETSFANGGQLSASNAEVWNHWSTVIKGVKWMFRRDAPLLMNPAPCWHKYSWMAEFVRHIADYRANTVATARLAIAARKNLFDWAKRENIVFDHETRGILHIYRNQGGFAHAAKVNALLAEAGLDRRAVTPEEIRAIEPALSGAYHGGFYTQSDSTGDIHKFTRGLAAAAERLGARFVLDASVGHLRHKGNGVEIGWKSAAKPDGDEPSETRDFDGVVVCAGIASRGFAAMMGDRVNVYPVKGYSITVALDDTESRRAAPWVSILDDDAKIVTSRLGADRFRVAGTAEFNGDNRDIRADRIRPLVEWSRRQFPFMSTERVTPWSGLRPMMPNMMPRVGPGRRRGVFYNTGHGHLGWTLAAGTAEAVAAKIQEAMPAG